MQYLRPPASRGPSADTCPRWLSPWLDRTSVLAAPRLSSACSSIFSFSTGFVKLGHPQSLPNLSSDEKNGFARCDVDIETRLFEVPISGLPASVCQT
jgi:hypothetical protein